MDYNDFYTITEYGNENWKGSFTPREIACNAYDYKAEYDYSIKQGKPTRTMIELCKLICEDMDYADYAEIQEESEKALTIERMKQILNDFVMEIQRLNTSRYFYIKKTNLKRKRKEKILCVREFI